MPTTYDPRDPSTYKYLPQMERDRVERQRAFQREMKGTFDQNVRADMDKTRLQSRGQMDVTGLQNEGAMARARLSDDTLRRGQNMDSQYRQDQLFQQGLLDSRRDQTLRRGQDMTYKGQQLAANNSMDIAKLNSETQRYGYDIQEKIGGYQYPTVDTYERNDQGFMEKTGESVVPYRLGQPVGGANGGQPAASENPRKLFDAGYTPELGEFYHSKPPEYQAQLRKELTGHPKATEILKGLQGYRDKGAQNQSAGPARPQWAPGRGFFGNVRDAMFRSGAEVRDYIQDVPAKGTWTYGVETPYQAVPEVRKPIPPPPATFTRPWGQIGQTADNTNSQITDDLRRKRQNANY